MRKVSYLSNGMVRTGDPEYALRKICGSCEFEESKRTGIWASELTLNQVSEWLFSVGYGPLVTKNGTSGKEIVARVPAGITDEKVMKVYEHLSQVQAKQRLDTCKACGDTCLKVLVGEIPVKEPIVVV